MNPLLLPNKELEDYAEQDCFDFLIKAEAMRIFLEQNSISLEKNKMLVLYGDWGSGKTSLMKHIENKIDEKIYKPIFFHAWEHEKDENLALSLCDAITECLDGSNIKIIKDFMNGALLTLKSFASGITLKSSGLLSGLGVEINASGEKMIKSYEEAIEKDNSENPSFYVSNKKFKDTFRKIEDLIIKKYNCQKILVFVDDLDRCEPENVLNLITALKLFFTYGEKTVFLSGIDKDAVTKAVKTKYKDVIKSEEYLEKVFDIAFNMPKIFSLRKLLDQHFTGKFAISGSQISNSSFIEMFLNTIKFTNPRHVKKVLNKYQIVKSFKSLTQIPGSIRTTIPNILIDGEPNGDAFETILSLFFIILHEFYPNELTIIENYEMKLIKYRDVYIETMRVFSQNADRTGNAQRTENLVRITSVETQSLDRIFNYRYNGSNYGYTKFVLLFANTNIEKFDIIHDDELKLKFSHYFLNDDILTNFCTFLIDHKDTIRGIESEFIPWKLFKMANYLL